MSKFVIEGGVKLKGTVAVCGNKNSTFGLFAAALVAKTPTTITNVPRLKDIEILSEVIRKLGAKVSQNKDGVVTIDPAGLNNWELDPRLASRLRGSVVLLAPLLARFGQASLPKLGGDSIGERLITTHTNMLAEFGAEVVVDHYGCKVTAKKLSACTVFLEEASVTATEIGLILAASIDGETTIEDAACEPHVVDLAEILTKMGAKISGAGTNTIRIYGNENLVGTTHSVRPDHMEAVTFAVASAITGGDVKIKGIIPQDLKMSLIYLSAMGVAWEVDKNTLHIKPSKLVARRKKFQSRPFPGFPTDSMSAFIVLATQTEGTVLCHDWMYEWRIFFVDHLISMGADIIIADPHRVIVRGKTQLFAEVIPSPDIRAGAALVLAALAAKGESTVEHAEVIDRGYENFDERLRGLGAKVRRVE